MHEIHLKDANDELIEVVEIDDELMEKVVVAAENNGVTVEDFIYNAIVTELNL